jgi:deoxyribodipyrimidine photo-lyase
MDKNFPVTVFWFRRDFRLDDNAGLYHALKSGLPVLPIFIFDKDILCQLQDKDDARATFIHQIIVQLDKELHKYGSSLLVLYDKPIEAWSKLLNDFQIKAVYANHDYEPYAKLRDETINSLLNNNNIPFNTYKDQVIFEKDEVIKDDGKAYTVYTPYQRKWYQTITPFYLSAYPN